MKPKFTKIQIVLIFFILFSQLATAQELDQEPEPPKPLTWYEAFFNLILSLVGLFIFYTVIRTLIDWLMGKKVDYLKIAQLKILKEAMINCPVYLKQLYISKYAKALGQIVGWSPDGIELLIGEDRKKVGKLTKLEIFVVAVGWHTRWPRRWLNFRCEKMIYLVPPHLRSPELNGNIDIYTTGFKEIGGFYFPYTGGITEKDASTWIKNKIDQAHLEEMQRQCGTMVQGALDMNPEEIKKVQLPEKTAEAGGN